MKKLLGVLLIASILLSGCTFDNEILSNESNVEPKSEGVLEKSGREKHVWMLLGRWADPGTNLPYFLEFFDDYKVVNGLQGVSFDGREGEVVDIKRNMNQLEVKIFYPELVLYGGEEVWEEMEETLVLTSSDNFENTFSLCDYGGEEHIYERQTKETDTEPKIILDDNAAVQDIPHVNKTSKTLGKDFTTMQIRSNYKLATRVESVASKIFYLQNLGDMSIYLFKDIGYHNTEYFGFVEEKVVFYGNYGLNGSKMRVKDFLPDEALIHEPATYPTEIDVAVDKVYLWKMENGYLAIYVYGDANIPFYDQRVLGVVHVSDLKYLSFVN